MVTGATGGIGEKICERIVKNNNNKLIIIGKNIKKIKSLTQKLKLINSKSSIYSYVIDLCDISTIEKKIEEIYQNHNTIDVVINNAGIGYFSPILTIDLSQIQKVMNVNFIACYLISKVVLKHMTKTKKQNYQIINISSIAGVKGFEFGSLYNSSKFAVEGFTQALWYEARKHEIKVCIIRPGLVDTCFFNNRNSFDNIGYALQPEDVAKCVEFVIQQSEYSNISEIVLRPIKSEAQTLFTKMIEK